MSRASTEPNLIIFDCDGVLVDSEPLSVRVLVETMARLGAPLSEQQCYALFLGRSFVSMKTILRQKFNLALTDADIEGMRNRLSDLFRQELKPIEGIARTVADLNVPCCVASSSLPERIRLSLEVTGLSQLFGEHVYSATMVKHGKPAPDLFLYAAAKMGVAPGRCIVVEDSPAGIEAAHRAGMKAFAFLGGSHAAPAGLRDAIGPLKPACFFERMEELHTLIKSP